MKKIISAVIALCLALSACAEREVFKDEISEVMTAPVEIAVPAALNPNGYASLPNAMTGWGLKKNVNAPPEIPASVASLLKKYNSYYISSGGKELFLTFDEGYENGYTADILDTLKEKGVPAAFFITAPYLKTERTLVARMTDEGHIVGNHTVHHPSLPSVGSAEEIRRELEELSESYYNEFGILMKYFRAPRGEFSERTLAVTNDLGYTNVFWSFAYKDWDVKNQKGAENAYNEIMKGVHDGCILLLHAVSKDNAETLARAIDDLKAQGYTFKSLDELS